MYRFVFKYKEPLFYFYGIVSVFFLVLIETTHNGGFFEAMRFLFIPIGIVVFGFFRINTKQINRLFIPRSKFKPWFYCLITYVGILFFSWPYFLAGNAIFSNYDAYGVYGKVIGTSTMRTNNGTKGANSSKSYLALVKEKKTSKTIRLQINEAEYKKLKKGDLYSECFYKGGFGVLFKWRFTTFTNC